MIIAIDGPAGAGKSTVARALAARLGFRYLDTGAMYRAVTWLALREGIALEDGAALAGLAVEHPVQFELDAVVIAGVDVTRAIRRAEIDAAVPTVAGHTEVRAVMRDRQRAMGESGDSVIEGRDIGEIVAPGAELKVYLVAAAAERARRRAVERDEDDVDSLEADLRRRDAHDAANTRRAADAVTIDTTSLSVDQVVRAIEAIVRERAPA